MPTDPQDVAATTGSGQARGDRQSHGILDRNVERLNAVARQIYGVAAEGIAHGKVDRDPVLAAVGKQYRRHILAGDETDGMHVGEPRQYDALQIPLLAAAGRQQADDVAKPAVQRFHEGNPAQEIVPVLEQDLAGIGIDQAADQSSSRKPAISPKPGQ